MSAHAPTADHGHHGSGDSVFTKAKSWFATKSPTKLNPLSATDAVAHNLVKWIVENTTGWVADILNPLWTAIQNAGSLVQPSKIRESGFFRNIGKSIAGITAHTMDAVNNLVSGSTFRGLDHLYTHGITNSLVDITSGTTDRIPVAGTVTWNWLKWVNVVPAAPIRFFARAWEKTVDRAVDWMKSFASVNGKARHLTTAHATAGAGHGGGHH